MKGTGLRLFFVCLLAATVLAEGDWPRRIFVRLIDVPTKEEAVRITDQLETGASFSELARRHSTLPSAGKGGFVGAVLPQRLEEPFRRGVQGLAQGRFSRPFELPGQGWRIVYRMPDDFRMQAEHLLREGDRLSSENKDPEAIGKYLSALECYPDFVHAHLALGLAYGRIGQRRQEEKAYRAAIDAEPQFFQAYHNLGTALWLTGERTEAVRILEQAVAIKPDLFKTYVNLSSMYTALGRLDSAEASARAAIRANPLLPTAYYSLGSVQHQRQDYRAALASFETAAALDPLNAEFSLTVAASLLKLGEKKKAEQYLQSILRHNPDFAAARDALAQLEMEESKKP